MSEDTQSKLGKLITGEGYRDAVHIAVAPVIAGGSLVPGQHVGLNERGEAATHTAAVLGVVDPFLTMPVEKGKKFWLFLYPNTITSLRHQWTHPLFAAPPEASTVPPEIEQAMKWFQGREEDYGFQTGALILAVLSGDGFCFGDDDGPEWARSRDFWRHMEIVTGRQFGEDHRENTYFRCAC